MEAAKSRHAHPMKNSKLHDASNWADDVGEEGDVSLPEGDLGAGVRGEGGDDGSSDEGACDGGGGKYGIIGDGIGKYEGAGEPIGGEDPTAITTTTNLCPLSRLPGFPLTKKHGPDLSNLNLEFPSSSFCIGFEVLHE